MSRQGRAFQAVRKVALCAAIAGSPLLDACRSSDIKPKYAPYEPPPAIQPQPSPCYNPYDNAAGGQHQPGPDMTARWTADVESYWSRVSEANQRELEALQRAREIYEKAQAAWETKKFAWQDAQRDEAIPHGNKDRVESDDEAAALPVPTSSPTFFPAQDDEALKAYKIAAGEARKRDPEIAIMAGALREVKRRKVMQMTAEESEKRKQQCSLPSEEELSKGRDADIRALTQDLDAIETAVKSRYGIAAQEQELRQLRSLSTVPEKEGRVDVRVKRIDPPLADANTQKKWAERENRGAQPSVNINANRR